MKKQTRSLKLPVIIAAVVGVILFGAGVFVAPLALRGPSIVAIAPADSAQDVNPQAPIRIEFDQPVDPESVAAALTFDPPTTFRVTGNGGAIEVQPEGDLAYETDYRLTLAPTVRNVLGRTMEEPLTIAFATVPYLRVVEVGPAADAADVALNASLTVVFDHPAVSADLIAAVANDPRRADELPQPLVLRDAAGEPVDGVGRWIAPTRYSFSPADGLHAAMIYSATLPVDLTADGAARLEQLFAWTFTTGAEVLVGYRPYNGATDVPVDSPIEVRLARDVDVAAAGAQFRLVDAETGTPAPGVIETTNDSFFFKPSQPLERGRRYKAELGGDIRTTHGAHIENETIDWSFTVIGDLAIDQVEPPAGTGEVLTDTRRISVRFNHPVVAVTTIDAQAAQPDPLTISPPLAGEGRWLDTSTYAFSPTEGLAPSTSYRVEVAAGLRDQTGGTLQEGYAWNFATIVPAVFETQPFDGDRFAGPRDPIEVIFNQPMDAASLRSAITLRRGDGTALPGAITVDGSVATFTPATLLERGATYTLAVSTGARSANGKANLASGFSSTFQVAPPPALAATEPGNGAGAVETNSAVQLIFSTPMDWPTVERNLTITPEPGEVYTSTNENVLYLYFDLEPETDYSISVGAAASDPYSATLGQEAEFAFRTAPLAPDLTLVGPYQIGMFNAYAPVRVPIQTVNVADVDYALYPLEVEQTIDLLNDFDAWRNFRPDPDTAIQSSAVDVTGERNRTNLSTIAIGSLDAGLYYLEVRGADIVEQRVLAASPYALTIKRSAERLFVWAVDLADGRPVTDLPLMAMAPEYDMGASEATSLGRTDGEGVLHTAFQAADPYGAIFLWSAAGDSFTFATTDWSEGIDPWAFNLPATYESNPIVGSLYTDRPIYRPNQMVHIRGVVRLDNDGRYTLPTADRRANLLINDPEGNTVLSTTLALTEFGGFSTDLPLRESAKLGSYTLIGWLGDDNQSHSFYGSFRVAEYRKPTFEITAEPLRPEVVQGDELSFAVEARYFSGGALANAPVRWRLLAAPYIFAPESAPGFQFQDLDDAYAYYRWFDGGAYYGEEYLGDGTATTDAQGRVTVRVPATLGDDGSSRRLTLDVDVTDVDGQVISSQGTAVVHAGEFYVGVRPEGYIAQAGSPQTFALITLDPQETPVANRDVEVELYQREWFSVREQSNDGQFYWTSSYTDTLVQSETATTDAQGRASVELTPADGGSYKVVATARDDAGNTITASAFTWVYGGDVFWGIDDSNRVDLITDRADYRPGDTAHILVTAPYKDMSALMTIERGEVIEHRLLTLPDTTALLDVPITAAHAPNVYVSLVLIKPADADLPVPDVRVGLVNLAVSTEQQELTIAVTPDQEQAGPRDELTYTIRTTDHAGQGVAAEVSLALVDKAVLTLVDDPNPTLRQAFYEKRPLGVFTAQSLTALVDRVTLRLQPGDKGGGGAAFDETSVRRDFPDTAYWNAALVTDANGEAQVTVQLPDSLTTWRMTARGLTADTRVGEATEDIIATKPLLVRPSLPRFLTVGDEVTLQAVVHNNASDAIEATVALEIVADDADDAAATLTLEDPAEQTVTVDANGQAVVRWRASVPEAGAATLRFRVGGGGLEDAVEQALPIQRFATPETVASAGQVFDVAVETLRLPAAQDTAQGEVSLELVPSLAAGVESGLDYLEAFPYACSEQTVSSFLPNAVTYRLYKELGIDDADLKAALERNLAGGLQRLYTLQNLDGGWGWWGEGESQPYLTAYVIQGLTEASKAGYGVDQQAYASGIAYLEAALDGDALRIGAEKSWRADARAYILFVLAEAGQPDRGRTIALYDTRAWLDNYGRAYLLMTLDVLSGEEDRTRTLVADLMSSAILQPTSAHWEERSHAYWTMSSDARTTALALQALVRVDPDNFLIPNAVRYLMSLRDRGHWQSTQETAITLMALAEYIVQSGELEGDYSYRVSLDDATLRESAVNRDNLADPVEVVFALAQLRAGADNQLTIQRQATGGQSGAGRLYYTLRMRTFTDANAVEPLDRGIGVTREYIAVDTATLTPTGELVSQARLGDVVQVRLTLTVPDDVVYLAVEDMLPAGLEPLDSSLKTVSAAAQDPMVMPSLESLPYWWFFGQSEIHDDRVALFADVLPQGTYHYTYLARAVTPGVFQTLPATAYQMYAPEVFGRSAGALFTVEE